MGTEKAKIAMVCQRYGAEVNGGAELHCRQVAERLVPYYDVTVYTTCAIDYMSWKNEYPEGETELNGVRIIRYRVSRKRSRSLGLLSEKVFFDPTHTDEEEKQWIDDQGPYCPKLIRALKEEHGQYKKVIFMTYLYYTTAVGLPLGFENAVLIPTVHDEYPVRLRYYDSVFGAAKGFIWNTEEEKRFAEKRFPHIRNTPGIMAGVGVDAPQGTLPEIPDSLKGKQYIVYAGRIDESKGCKEMFSYFRRYRDEQGNGLKLALIGKPVMDIPEDEDIIQLGFVSDETKYAVMRDAFALVLFSRFESLSIVVLESMMMNRPVLVTGHSEVLKGHCIRSNAGLYFNSYPEFAGALNYLEEHPAAYETMCRNGEKYVRENYRWDVIIHKYRRFFGDL